LPESFRYRDQHGDVQIGRPPVLLLSVGGDSLSRIRTHPDRRNTSERGVLLLAGVSNTTTNNTSPSDLTLKNHFLVAVEVFHKMEEGLDGSEHLLLVVE